MWVTLVVGLKHAMFLTPFTPSLFWSVISTLVKLCRTDVQSKTCWTGRNNIIRIYHLYIKKKKKSKSCKNPKWGPRELKCILNSKSHISYFTVSSLLSIISMHGNPEKYCVYLFAFVCLFELHAALKLRKCCMTHDVLGNWREKGKANNIVYLKKWQSGFGWITDITKASACFCVCVQSALHVGTMPTMGLRARVKKKISKHKPRRKVILHFAHYTPPTRSSLITFKKTLCKGIQ